MGRYVFLGVVQGLTEFLPVSSSAHLLLLGRWLGLAESGPLLVAFLHVGTLLALLVWFRKELLWLVSAGTPQGREARSYLGRLGLGMIPLLGSALLFAAQREGAFSSPKLAAGFLFVTAALLFGAQLVRPGTRKLPTPGQALLIGLAQAVAVLPGVSRSGATLSVALFLGLAPEEAFRFSFLLGIPAFVGAPLLALRESGPPESWLGLSLGALFAFLFGLFALRLFRAGLVHRKLWPFGLYCLLLGLVSLLWG